MMYVLCEYNAQLDLHLVYHLGLFPVVIYLDMFDKFLSMLLVISDLDIILEEEACNSEDKGWKFLRKTDDGDELWRKSVPGQTINLVKVG